MHQQRLVGGSFAPPLTDAHVTAYSAAIAALPDDRRLKDALSKLLACCEAWWALPEPVGTEVWDHPSGVGTVVSLQDDHAAALYDLIPWSARSNGTGAPDELEAIQATCDAIPAEQKATRDMAFHLLWHVVELDLDREPMTKDKL